MLRRKPLFALLAFLVGCSSNAKEPKPAGPPRSPTYPQPFHLFPLLNLSNPLLVETSTLLAKTATEAEKETAGERLVQLARAIDTQAWRDQQRFTVARLHGSIPTAAMERKMLDDLTRRHQLRVYDAMTALGSEPVLDHCAGVVENDDLKRTEKQLAIAVLSAHGRADLTPPTASVPVVGSGAQARGQSGATASFSAPPEVQGGQIINTGQVVNTLSPYFVVCYERALAQHGRFGAWISLQADISAQNGRVYAVGGKGDDVPPAMMQCLYGVMQQAQFQPPRGGDARISLSLSFTPPDTRRPSG